MFTAMILSLLSSYGLYALIIIFLILFIETGLVFVPFLPGDSMLFMSGAFLAASGYNPILVIILFSIAAISGDFLNYSLGKKYGLRLRHLPIVGKWIKEEHITKTQTFFDKHGASAISLGRFIPIVRTFIPFIAGLCKMNSRQFLNYNIIGGISWVLVGVLSGFFFGSLPLVKQNFELIMLAIVFVSILPIVVIALKKKVRISCD